MTMPNRPKRHDEKDRVDLAVDQFAKKKNPTQADLNAVVVTASVQAKIDSYRANVNG